MKTSHVLYRLAVFLACSAGIFGQAPTPGTNVVHVVAADTVKARPGATLKVPLSVQVDEGFHVNSNTPADQFLIPLRLTWSPGALESAGITFPKPDLQKYSFSEKPVSIFTGKFEIVTRFKVAPGASPGAAVVTGKLRYQACTEGTCLAPKTIDVTVPVEIEK